MTELTNSAYPSAGLLPRIASRLERMRHLSASRAILNELAKRPDYLLKDIGLTRFDLNHAIASRSLEDMLPTLIRARQNPLQKAARR